MRKESNDRHNTCCEAPSMSSSLVQKEVEGSHLQVQGDASVKEASGRMLPSFILSSSESLFTDFSPPSAADNGSCNVMTQSVIATSIYPHTFRYFLVIQEWCFLISVHTAYSFSPGRENLGKRSAEISEVLPCQGAVTENKTLWKLQILSLQVTLYYQRVAIFVRVVVRAGK